MSEVGDAVTLTMETTPGATVKATATRPDGVPLTEVPVAEAPAASGLYPYTFVPELGGRWVVLFVASGTVVARERHVLLVDAADAPLPYASVDDVVDVFGVLDVPQVRLTERLLATASRRMRSAVPALEGNLALGAVSWWDARDVAVAMVLRVLRNPAALSNESAGPFSVNYNFRLAAGFLFVGQDELTQLAPAAAGNGGIGTVAFGVRARRDCAT
jgi:hypothetical protein